MFERLGTFVARYRKWIIAGWVLAAAVLFAVAPAIEDVSSTDQADFLPEGAPFVHAQEVYEQVFPDDFSPSNTMVLVEAPETVDVREPEIWSFIDKVETWLNSEDAPENVVAAVGPTANPDFADALVSPDGRIALITVPLNTPTDAVVTTKTVEVIDEWLESHEPEDLTVYQTGEAALNAQAEETAFATMDRTIVITVLLVIVALLVIYRSPVSPLIPLFTVTVAYMVTVSLVSILGDLGVVSVMAQVVTLLVVVMYGAGTDYCLFLISRFREEMADEIGIKTATKRTVHKVGETISSSAGTIFVGFISMTFAELGAFKSAGPTLALGIAVSLLAGLTLAPALLATLGNRAFWPGKASHRSTGRWYEMASKQVSSRPLVTIMLIVAIMLPFSVYGLTQQLNYDPLSELPKEIDSVKAYDLLADHMGAGNLFPLAVVATGRDTDSLAADVAKLSKEISEVDGVDDVRGLNSPLGRNRREMRDLMRVDGQLGLLLSMAATEDEAAPVDPGQAMALIAGMQRYIDLIAERFPELAGDENMATAREIVSGGLEGMAFRELELMAAVAGLMERFRGIEDAYIMPPTGEGDLFAMLQPLKENYTASGGSAYRLEVVLDDPLSESGMATVREIRNSLERSTQAGAASQGDSDTVVSGYTAVFADIQDVMARDQVRIYAFVLAGIFLVLLLMLRSVVAPIYLIGTVFLSFTCTLGLTGLFFRLVFDVDKLSWMLPIFTFVFLVALGIDYSIFLFGRIKEEVAKHGVREGVHVAVARTGAIITSAGIILAGTFAGMMAGEMMLLKQLGFAVAVGVLIDTFVVRTILDPALAAFFGRWTWWPGGVPSAREPQPIRPVPVPETGG